MTEKVSLRLLRVAVILLMAIYVARILRAPKDQAVITVSENKSSSESTPPQVQKSILGNVKDVIVKKNAIPSHYREMESLKNDFMKAIRANKEPDWNILIQMGDIYARGSFPYLQPNDSAALSLYMVAAKTPDPNTASISVSRYVDVKHNPVDRADRQGEPMRLDYAHEIARAANTYIRNAPAALFRDRKPTLKLAMVPPPPVTGPIFFSKPPPVENRRPRIVQRQPPANTATAPAPATTTPAALARARRNDSQNTHDHGVTSATKANIKRLKNEFEGLGLKHDSNDVIIEKAMRIFRDVRERSKRDTSGTVGFTADQLADCHNVVTTLTPDEYSGTGVSQLRILGLVLWKLGTLDRKTAEGVEETLGKRVASGIERGVPVCATGKISRCLSVFEGVLEDTQKSVSINVVKKEIAQLSSKVRDDFLAKVGPTGMEAYCSELSVPEYSERMADDLRKRVREEYVEKLSFSPSVIDPIVDVYAEAY